MRIAPKSAGFTLLEMLVVLVIIGLIASLVGPRLFSRVDTSKVDVFFTTPPFTTALPWASGVLPWEVS